jgi:hypothetical protein
VQGVVSSNLAIPTNQKPYDFVRLFLWAQVKRSLSAAPIKRPAAAPRLRLLVEASLPEIIENNLAIPTNQKPYDFVRLFLWAQVKRSASCSASYVVRYI